MTKNADADFGVDVQVKVPEWITTREQLDAWLDDWGQRQMKLNIEKPDLSVEEEYAELGVEIISVKRVPVQH